MDKKQTKEIITNLKSVSDMIPSDDLFKTIRMLCEANIDNNKTKVEIAKIENQTNYLIQEMRLKYELYYNVFGRIFSERKIGIDKSFEIINKGLKENNKDLISSGLGGLSDIISTSPFSNISELDKLLRNDNIIEI